MLSGLFTQCERIWMVSKFVALSDSMLTTDSAIEKLGNPGWNWENFYKYSKKSESFFVPERVSVGDYRDLYKSDTFGPVKLSFTQTSSGIERPVQQSLKLLGVETIDDSMSGETVGTFKVASDLDPATGKRCSAATVLTEAHVTKLVTETSKGEVVTTAVEFEHGGTLHKVLVGKEVILCAGTIQSPQILELSGIGDRNILEPLNIEVQKHLPSVGRNLQDHIVSTGLVLAMRDEVDLITSESMTDEKLTSRLRCTFLPLQAFSDRAESTIAELKAKVAREDEHYAPGLREQYELLSELLANPRYPAMELFVFPFDAVPPVELDGDVRSSITYSSQKPFPVLMPSILHPLSRGTIHICSSDPKRAPNIDPRYFEEEADMDVLLDAFKFTRKMSQMAPFQVIAGAELAPGPKAQTDEEIRAHIEKNLHTTWHSCGTCSMLPEDKGGVVDSKLKVYGTSNIRIVDLSILPLIVSVHTQTVAYGIAEMAADIIKEQNSANA
ncbi:hypothetical protein EVJ58_g2548 [Rhodofomes roseus]|uniref:Glucose-methanol-choline oxidoreductase N-terminal domain-containing protein n=1 Tax=Rhodofomes roseus TaxID=34475 RepID=A0A4Y9YQC6_9APHY|nr:hypothetical protein EVJ58_g2548 [Rhodofomes roseus]